MGCGCWPATAGNDTEVEEEGDEAEEIPCPVREAKDGGAISAMPGYGGAVDGPATDAPTSTNIAGAHAILFPLLRFEIFSLALRHTHTQTHTRA